MIYETILIKASPTITKPKNEVPKATLIKASFIITKSEASPVFSLGPEGEASTPVITEASIRLYLALADYVQIPQGQYPLQEVNGE